MSKKPFQFQMCLGGCMITSKTKINIFWNCFLTPGSLHCPAKMDFFPHFSSLCNINVSLTALWYYRKNKIIWNAALYFVHLLYFYVVQLCNSSSWGDYLPCNLKGKIYKKQIKKYGNRNIRLDILYYSESKN